MHPNNLIALFALLSLALLLFAAIKKPKATLQTVASALLTLIALLCIAAAPASRDYVLSTLVVWPAASENGTNSFIVKNKAGTNWVAIDPTNAALKMRISGTNYTGITWTNISVTNAAASSGKRLTFKNGLLVEVMDQP